MNRSDEANFHRDAIWKGNDLIFKRRVVASVVSDSKYPQMWRVRLPNGHLTDMVNLSRAKDAAKDLALKALMRGRVGASPMRSFSEAAERPPEEQTRILGAHTAKPPAGLRACGLALCRTGICVQRCCPAPTTESIRDSDGQLLGLFGKKQARFMRSRRPSVLSQLVALRFTNPAGNGATLEILWTTTKRTG